ncbi:MAG: flagellar biosynthetic protein FliR, partial [Deltaproteobacteria bacterium]|nr:flagellar biosynthetic protein FliR [Deltaproteobacteria bacterium]
MEILSVKTFLLSFFLIYVRLFAALTLIPFLSGKTLPVMATGAVCAISAFFIYYTYPQLVMLSAAIDSFSFILILIKEVIYG